MNFSGRLLACLGGVALALATAPAQAAETPRYSLTTGLDFSSGNYGSSADTEMWYLPVTLKYQRGPGTLKVTVPYLRITAPAGATVVGYDDDGRPIYASGGSGRTTNEGLGDVVLTYSHGLYEQPGGGLLVDLGAKVKLPTAGAAKGLGSGKTDYAVYTDLYYQAGALSPFATLGYRVMGDPAGIDLRNVWYGTLGLAYRLSERDSVGAMWDLRQATLAGGDGINELTAYWAHRLGAGLKLQAYGVAGFSHVSPDYGLGLMVTVASR
jgi:hypothetical protein